MKIDSYEVNMQASSSLVQKYEKIESASSVNKSYNEDNPLKIEDKKIIFNSEDDLSIEDKIKKRVIEELLSNLLNSNEKIKLFPNENYKLEESTNNSYSQKSQEWGFTYKSKEEYYEKSTFDFSAKAIIQTSKGEIEIDLSLSYSKEYYQKNETKFSAYAKGFENPFKIDMQDEVGSFENIKKEMEFEFSRNNNREKNDITQLENGVSYLAIDKNSNNSIDDGSELFGVNTNNGFEELSYYDKDGNNWIDENDEVFKDLRVWEKSADGNHTLISLADSGIGAIYLGNTSSVNNNQTSIFLKENGEAGVISSVDFRV